MVSAWFPGSTIWEVAMAEIRPIVGSATPASFVLGRKLDSVPFGAYHVLIIAVLALVGFIEGLRSGDDRLALGAGQGTIASDRVRHPLARGRPDLNAGPRRLRVLGDIRSLQPQERDADRGGRHHVFYLADPAGAKCRAADHRASADGPWRGRRGLGGVPDRRRIDAGAASAHLQRDL